MYTPPPTHLRSNDPNMEKRFKSFAKFQIRMSTFRSITVKVIKSTATKANMFTTNRSKEIAETQLLALGAVHSKNKIKMR